MEIVLTVRKYSKFQRFIYYTSYISISVIWYNKKIICSYTIANCINKIVKITFLSCALSTLLWPKILYIVDIVNSHEHLGYGHVIVRLKIVSMYFIGYWIFTRYFGILLDIWDLNWLRTFFLSSSLRDMGRFVRYLHFQILILYSILGWWL